MYAVQHELPRTWNLVATSNLLRAPVEALRLRDASQKLTCRLRNAFLATCHLHIVCRAPRIMGVRSGRSPSQQPRFEWACGACVLLCFFPLRSERRNIMLLANHGYPCPARGQSPIQDPADRQDDSEPCSAPTESCQEMQIFHPNFPITLWLRWEQV